MQVEPIVRGQCTIVTAVMGAGKSHYTLGKANRDKAAGIPHLVIQHVRAVRTKSTEVTSRSGVTYHGARTYRRVSDIERMIQRHKPHRIYLTDMHFVDINPAEGMALYRLIIRCLEAGIDVIVDTLERDFRGEAFETPGRVHGISDIKHYFSADCEWPGCESSAHYNQRLHHRRPVTRDSARFETDTPAFRKFKSYEARCRKHFACPEQMDEELRGILEAQRLAYRLGQKHGRESTAKRRTRRAR